MQIVMIQKKNCKIKTHTYLSLIVKLTEKQTKRRQRTKHCWEEQTHPSRP